MLDITNEDALILMNLTKVRYTELTAMLPDRLPSKITMVIDSAKLFEGFAHSYTAEVAKSVFQKKLDYNLVGEFINWLAHYRRYFRTRDCHLKFILLHGFTDKSAQATCPDWNSDYRNEYSKFLNFVVEKRIKPVVQYIPDVYVINSEVFETPVDRSTILATLTTSLGNEDLKLLMSKNIILFTGDYAMMNSLFLVKSKFNINVLRGTASGGNFITESKLFDYLCRKTKTNVSVPDHFLPYYLAIVGANGIKRIHPKATHSVGIKIVLAAYEDYKVNSSIDLDEVVIEKAFQILKPLDKTNELPAISDFIDEFDRRISVLDTSRLNHALTVDEVFNSMFSDPNFELASDMNTKYLGDIGKLNYLF